MTTTIGAGLGGKLQSGLESAYGTPATLDAAHEFVSESLQLKIDSYTSKAIRQGSYAPLSSRRVQTTKTVEGSIETEVLTKGMGRWFALMFGTTATPAQQASSAAYLQTHTLSTTLRSATIQVARPYSDGTIVPFTYHGCMCTGWEFSIQPQEPLMLKMDIDGEDADTSTGEGAVSYPTGLSTFSYAMGTIKKNNSSIGKVLSATISGKNPLKTDSHFLGGAGLKTKPAWNDFVDISGSLSVEWADKTVLHDVWTAGTSIDIDFEFVHTTAIESTYYPFLKIALPTCYLDGSAPNVGGPDVLTYDVPFKAFYDGSNAPITLTYQSVDTAL